MKYQKIQNTKKFQKIHNEIIQRKLQMRMIKEYMYFQKKERKLLIIYDQ